MAGACNGRGRKLSMSMMDLTFIDGVFEFGQVCGRQHLGWDCATDTLKIRLATIASVDGAVGNCFGSLRRQLVPVKL